MVFINSEPTTDPWRSRFQIGLWLLYNEFTLVPYPVSQPQGRTQAPQPIRWGRGCHANQTQRCANLSVLISDQPALVLKYCETPGWLRGRGADIRFLIRKLHNPTIDFIPVTRVHQFHRIWKDALSFLLDVSIVATALHPGAVGEIFQVGSKFYPLPHSFHKWEYTVPLKCKWEVTVFWPCRSLEMYMGTCSFLKIYMGTCSSLKIYMGTCSSLEMYMGTCSSLEIYMGTCSSLEMYMGTCSSLEMFMGTCSSLEMYIGTCSSLEMYMGTCSSLKMYMGTCSSLEIYMGTCSSLEMYMGTCS